HEGARGGEHAAPPPDPVERLVEPDGDAVALHERPVLGAAERSAPASDDRAAGPRGELGEDFALDLAEVRLAPLDEDPDDRGARRLFDDLVHVRELPAEARGEQAS